MVKVINFFMGSGVYGESEFHDRREIKGVKECKGIVDIYYSIIFPLKGIISNKGLPQNVNNNNKITSEISVYTVNERAEEEIDYKLIEFYSHNTRIEHKPGKVILYLNNKYRIVFDSRKTFDSLHDLEQVYLYFLGKYVGEILVSSYTQEKSKDIDYIIDILDELSKIDEKYNNEYDIKRKHGEIIKEGAEALLTKNILLYGRYRTRRSNGEITFSFDDFISSGSGAYKLLKSYYPQDKIIDILSRKDKYRFFVDIFHIAFKYSV